MSPLTNSFKNIWYFSDKVLVNGFPPPAWFPLGAGPGGSRLEPVSWLSLGFGIKEGEDDRA